MEPIKDRTVRFSLRIITLSESLPTHRAGDAVARQIIRSGTSPGAYFREALRARSKAEYVAKLNGGLMEFEETLYWFEIIAGKGYIARRRLTKIIDETNQLIALFVSLIKTWKPRSR